MVKGLLIEVKNALFQAMVGGIIRKEVWSFDFVLCYLEQNLVATELSSVRVDLTQNMLKL